MGRIVPVISLFLSGALILFRFRVLPREQDPDGWNSLLAILGLGALAVVWSVVGLRRNSLSGDPVYGPLALFILPIACFFSYGGNLVLTVVAALTFCLVTAGSIYDLVHA